MDGDRLRLIAEWIDAFPELFDDEPRSYWRFHPIKDEIMLPRNGELVEVNPFGDEARDQIIDGPNIFDVQQLALPDVVVLGSFARNTEPDPLLDADTQ